MTLVNPEAVMTTCTSCAGTLYACDAGFTTCVECERAAVLGRDVGMARATAARPDDAARVDAAIRQLAARGGEFSSNDARRLHGVKGPVVGARFKRRREGRAHPPAWALRPLHRAGHPRSPRRPLERRMIHLPSLAAFLAELTSSLRHLLCAPVTIHGRRVCLCGREVTR